METVRDRLIRALAKPLPDDPNFIHMEVFDPWEDVINGIHGCYSSEFDRLFIDALKSVRDQETFEFMEKHGAVAELILYVLSGHGYTEYGTSPRGAWPDPTVNDLWQPLIDKWEAYYRIVWLDGQED